MLYFTEETQNIKISRHNPGGSSFQTCSLILTKADGTTFNILNIPLTSTEFFWSLDLSNIDIPSIPVGQYTYTIKLPNNLAIESGICIFGNIETNIVNPQNNTITVYEKN